MTTLLVLAKAPEAGRTKTRLTPPCTPDEAAALAQAALVDTLAAVRATPVDRRIVVLEGEPGPWLPPGFDVVAQAGGPFADRLAAAFTATTPSPREPTVLIGMDTPQVTPALLEQAFGALFATDSVLGPTHDGGYWAIGLHRADERVFAGVPMSTATTRSEQDARLQALGLRRALLPFLPDVDTFEDALEVAAAVPESSFAAAVRALACRCAERDHASMPATAGPPSALVTETTRRTIGKTLTVPGATGPVLDVTWGAGLGALFDDSAPGGYGSAVLPDGVVGAGGAPVRVLRRVARLLRPGGLATVELEPPGTAPLTVEAWLEAGGERVGPVAWTPVGADTIDALAGPAGLHLTAAPDPRDGRWYATLVAP